MTNEELFATLNKAEEMSLENWRMYRTLYNAELGKLQDRIELLEAALRTIDNMIPKDSPNIPVMAMVAGDIAEGALNGTWPAFGVLPRAALGEKKDDS